MPARAARALGRLDGTLDCLRQLEQCFEFKSYKGSALKTCPAKEFEVYCNNHGIDEQQNIFSVQAELAQPQMQLKKIIINKKITSENGSN